MTAYYIVKGGYTLKFGFRDCIRLQIEGDGILPVDERAGLTVADIPAQNGAAGG